jgi:hypothetical protein
MLQQMLQPGAEHPHPLRPAGELAAWLGVEPARVDAWISAGLPSTPEGIDAFAAVNWLSDRLDEAPILRARWQRFLGWFAPFVAGEDRAASRYVTRSQRLFLPHEPQSIRWWIPRLQDAVNEEWSVPQAVTKTHVKVYSAEAEACATVKIRPERRAAADLLPLVEEVIDGFTYGYRHHRPNDDYHGRMSGSCLDLTFAVGQRLTDIGRPWRLCSGVIAHTALANPHFWLEVEATGGVWIPVDPTLPALAKRFATLHRTDWRTWARAYTGGCDARRVTLCRGEAPLRDIPGGSTIGSTIGEAVVDDKNAWSCIDWVCGECRWEFERG